MHQTALGQTPLLLTRYILREVLATGAGALALLALVFAAWSAAGLLADAVNGRFAGAVVLELLLLRTLIAGEVLLPTALFVGAVWAYTRLDRDAELAAVYAAGIQPRQLLLPAALAGLLGGLLVALLTLVARPWAYQVSYSLEEALVPQDIARLETNRFHQWGDDLTLLAGSADLDSSRLGDVFAERKLGTDWVQVVRARWLAMTPVSAEAAGEQGHPPGADVRRLDFSSGRAWALPLVSDAGQAVRSYAFATLSFTAAVPGGEGVRNQRRARNTMDLLGASGGKERAELEWRALLGPLTFGVVLLAAVLGRGRPRTPVYPRLLLAAGVFVLLFVLASAARTAVENGSLPSMLWVLLVPLAMVPVVPALRARLGG